MGALEGKLNTVREAVLRYGLLITAHADEEAREEDISLQEIHEVIARGEIIEDYPAHRRGPCCLLYAKTRGGRDIHVVMTIEKVPPRVITVYEPKPPRWVTPRERRRER